MFAAQVSVEANVAVLVVAIMDQVAVLGVALDQLLGQEESVNTFMILCASSPLKKVSRS